MSEQPGGLERSTADEDAIRAPQGGAPETVEVRRGMFGPTGTGDTSGYGGLVQAVQMPGLPPDVDSPFAALAGELASALPTYERAVERVVVDRDELTFHVRREDLVDVMRALRDDPALRFEMCMGVSGVHFPDEKGTELHAVYPMLSVTHNRRARVEVTCPDADPHIPSVVSVYPGNDWHERETFDFFGIVFDGHPGLTRIEMPDDWPGHPQRKDYPLGGIPVEYKGAQIPPPDERRAYS